LKRRTRYDIYMDALEAIRRRGAAPITRVSYGANMPVDRAKDVVSFLSERGLVEEQEHDGSRRYRITARGGEFLRALRTVKRYLKLHNPGVEPRSADPESVEEHI
jgi:predicted transcriptional regulator